jgi:AGZA family xanthine/uracil permease-like MFS transporter
MFAEISHYFTTAKNKVKSYFKIEERGSTILTELRAGTVTFFTMGYILAVNAAILGDSGGTCDGESENYDQCQQDLKIDLIYATAISAGVSTLLMGLTANLPLALAPGMGLNAYFTYDVVGFRGSGKVSYQNALFATFIEGFIFLALSMTGFRFKLMNLIPKHVKYAMTAGIGLFLAHLGMQSAEGIGLVTSHTATKVTLGGCGVYNEVSEFVPGFGSVTWCPVEEKMEGATTWIGIAGFALMSLLLIFKVRGSIFITILLVTLTSWLRNTDFTYFPETFLGEARYEYFKNVVDLHVMDKTPFVLFENINLASNEIWVALVTFLYVDMLDTAGTLFSMAEYAGMTDANGNFEGQTAAFCSDAVGTIFGSLLGTSSVTTYIESAAGIEEGGRTGLTAVVVALFFFLSLVFAPIFASIPPWATGPALIIIGSLMMKSVMKINWNNTRHAIPAFVTIIVMPLTYSIAYGIMGGLMMALLIYLVDKVVDMCPTKKELPAPTPAIELERIDEEDKVELAICE